MINEAFFISLFDWKPCSGCLRGVVIIGDGHESNGLNSSYNQALINVIIDVCEQQDELE